MARDAVVVCETDTIGWDYVPIIRLGIDRVDWRICEGRLGWPNMGDDHARTYYYFTSGAHEPEI